MSETLKKHEKLGILNRYEQLGLREYQNRAYYYPLVCKELSLILRGIYTKVPKNLQSLIFEDTLAAFRFIPQLHPGFAREAANLLLQAAEVAFPKHKRVLAAAEFKHAIVAYKRRHRAQKDDKGSAHLPMDVLVHIFSFLDMRSLIAVGLVCWSWNSAANDNNLWKSQYEIFFGSSNSGSETKGQIGELTQKPIPLTEKNDRMEIITTDWKEQFKQTCIGNLSGKFTSNRGYCFICEAVVWHSNLKCPNVHNSLNGREQQIKPISPQKIVEYLLQGIGSTDSSSDTDSDSDESYPKLWSVNGLFF